MNNEFAQQELVNCTQTSQRFSTKTKAAIIVTAVLLICLVGVICYGIFGISGAVDPFDYISVRFDGYDGYGHIICKLDKDALIQELIGPIPDRSNINEYTAWVALRDEYKNSIKVTCSRYYGLSNQDRVLVSVQVSEFAAEKIQSKACEIRVEGLSPLREIDVFADLEVQFEGVNGAATAQCVKADGNAVLKVCRLSLSQERSLSTGDTVTVSITNADTLASSYGCRLLATEKQYTVPPLPEYLTKPEQVDPEDVQQMVKQFIADEKERLAQDIYFTYSEPVYYGTYICAVKPDAWYVEYSYILQIYITYDEYYDGEYWRTVYRPLEFYNLVAEPGETVSLNYADSHSSTFTDDIEVTMTRLSENYEISEVIVE